MRDIKMTTDNTTDQFTVQWLDSREAADRAARNNPLQDVFTRWLRKQTNQPGILDLGAGTGANFRALYELNQFWRLIDWDVHLLNEALRRHPHEYLTTYKANINALESLPWDNIAAVTASALFDLTSEYFIDNLVAQLSERRLALFATLNYEGTTRWLPAHPMDDIILHHFNLDQRRNKGFGLALGPDAVAYLSNSLSKIGFNVMVAESPWQLCGQDTHLMAQLIEGICNALTTAGATGQNIPVHTLALEDWRCFRLEHLHQTQCYVGHMDLLALPPE